jgi:hypothetical protein
LIGAAIKLAEGGTPPLKMDGDPVRANPGVVAGDITDRNDVRKALDVEHDNPAPKGPSHFCRDAFRVGHSCSHSCTNGRQFLNRLEAQMRPSAATKAAARPGTIPAVGTLIFCRCAWP